MRKKNVLMYSLISISVGYLLYHYLFSDVRVGLMMNHHYGYYDSYSSLMYYVNGGFVFVAYIILFVSVLLLLSRNTGLDRTAMTILDERLSKGDISVEEYKSIKEALIKK